MASKRRDRQFEDVCSLAKMRVHVAYRCVVALLPDADDRERVRIARTILTLTDGKDRSVRITEAQCRDLILPHIQCIQRECSLCCFWEPISRLLNMFFNEED